MLALTGVLAAGCDPATYTDIHFGTNLGADYMAPSSVRDAGEDADDTVDDAAPDDAAPGGTTGSAGTPGAAGAAGAGGTAANFGT